MRHLTIKDRAEMKYMGYNFRVFFKNSHGVPFHKDFTNRNEMEDFIARAEQVGTTTECIIERN